MTDQEQELITLRAQLDSKTKQMSELIAVSQLALNNFKAERERLVAENEKLDADATMYEKSLSEHEVMLKEAEDKLRDAEERGAREMAGVAERYWIGDEEEDRQKSIERLMQLWQQQRAK